MDPSTFFADLSGLEHHLGLPEGFLEGLIEEDDWSFIIKSHAVTEAALTTLISSSTDSRLKSFFARLPFDGRFSKVEVARALGGLDRATIEFASRLGRIRNLLVHDIKHLSFDLHSFFKEMSAQDRQSMSKLIAQTVTGSDEDGLVSLAEEALIGQPKLTLAVAISALHAHALFGIDPNEQQRALDRAKQAAPGFILIAILILVAALGSKGPGTPVAA